MTAKNRNTESWLDAVLHEVRFLPDRQKIRRELQEHIEDYMEDHMEGSESESRLQEEALLAMGEPVELGRQLNRQHKPWLGWLWLGSEFLCIITICIFVGVLVYGWVDNQVDRQMGTRSIELEESYEEMTNRYDAAYNDEFTTIIYHHQPEWRTRLENTEIQWRDVAYMDYDGKRKLEVVFTTYGQYSMGEHCLKVFCNEQSPDFAEHKVGIDQEGKRVGVYKITYETFDENQREAKFSYDMFGERFSFCMDLTTGEVL
ncbi:MAG: hypothetical protein HFE73_04430 [Firmicutes bacterium]|nr:hypothetical protein [Bacillota bacterium]